jgi:hypothetical protein
MGMGHVDDRSASGQVVQERSAVSVGVDPSLVLMVGLMLV